MALMRTRSYRSSSSMISTRRPPPEAGAGCSSGFRSPTDLRAPPTCLGGDTEDRSSRFFSSATTTVLNRQRLGDTYDVEEATQERRRMEQHHRAPSPLRVAVELQQQTYAGSVAERKAAEVDHQRTGRPVKHSDRFTMSLLDRRHVQFTDQAHPCVPVHLRDQSMSNTWSSIKPLPHPPPTQKEPPKFLTSSRKLVNPKY